MITMLHHNKKMWGAVIILTLVVLSCRGDVDGGDLDAIIENFKSATQATSTPKVSAESDGDIPKLMEEIFGPAPSTASSINKDVSLSTCRTGAGVNGKCVPSSNCLSESAAENVKYEGQCESNDDICCPLNEVGQKCGWGSRDTQSVRILSNTETNFAEYPWIVAVLHLVPTNESGGGKLVVFTCSGSLIHPKVVMTTAHNVHKLSDLRVRAGEWDTVSTDEVLPHQERNVDRIILHEAYNVNRMNLFNDMALLVLDKPMDLQPNVRTVCLPPTGQPPATGSRCYSSGWGKSNFGKKGAYQTTPKKVELPVVGRLECQTRLRDTRLGQFFKLHPSFLCAGGKKGLDTCMGDGGSPLMCSVPGENGRFMASGMVSWGIRCGEGTPAVYVDVSHLRPWLDDKMAALGFSANFYTI